MEFQLIATRPEHYNQIAVWPTNQRECDLWSGDRVRYPVDPVRMLQEIDVATAENRSLMGDGVLLGFAQVLHRSRGRAHLARIIVNPAHRGVGHGRRLVAQLVAYAEGSGARAVSLNVTNGNMAAEALYRSLGFAEVPRPSEDIAPSDCVYFERSLPSGV